MATEGIDATDDNSISAAGPADDMWGRPVVSIRMSSRRKAQLTRLASGLAPGATPSAAIDAAIERALTSPSTLPEPLAIRLSELEDAFEAAARDIKVHAQRRDSDAAEAARSSQAILALISAASGAEDARARPAAPPERIAQWLDRQLNELGVAADQSAIARVRWTGSRRVGNGSARVEFEATLAAVDGRSLAATATRGSAVETGAIDIDGSLFNAIAAHASTTMFVALRCSEDGWRATLFASSARGDLASKLGSIPG